MYDTLISMKYIISKTTAAASSSPLLSRRTKSATGPHHRHFPTVRVVSSLVASLSLSPAEFLLMNSNRKKKYSSTEFRIEIRKKVRVVLRSTSYILRTAVQIRKISSSSTVWYRVQNSNQKNGTIRSMIQYGTRVQRETKMPNGRRKTHHL